MSNSRPNRILRVLWALALLSWTAAGAIILAASFRLEYVPLKSYVESFSPNGRVAFFTPEFFQKMLGRLRLGGILLFGIGGLLLAVHGRILQWACDLAARIQEDRQAWFAFMRQAARDNRSALFIVVLLTLLGAGLRIAFMPEPPRYDEAFNYFRFATRPVYYILSVYNCPNNHIFHTLLMHISTRLLGNDPWALRLPALLAGILMIPAAYWAGRGLYNEAAGLLTAAWVSCSSYLIDYSVNARGYTLVALCVLCLTGLAGSLLRRDNLFAWSLFSLVSIIGFHTIPIMLIPFCGIFLWLFLSCLAGNAENTPGALEAAKPADAAKAGSARRQFIIRLFGFSSLSAIAVISLYLPVLMISGPKLLLNNEFVRPLPWPEFFANLRLSLRETWALWNRDVPPILQIGLIAGNLLCAIFYILAPKRRIPFAAALLASCVVLTLRQRSAPFARSWIFLLPFYYLFASAGAAELARGISGRFHFHSVILARAASLSLAILLGAIGLVSGSIAASRETGGLRDAAAIASDLSKFLQPTDSLVTMVPSAYPLMYAMMKKPMPDGSLTRPPESAARVFVLVNLSDDQTLPGVLKKNHIRRDTAGARIVFKYPTAHIYQLPNP